MNIKKLAEQAGCNKIDLYDIDRFIDLELFAQLVAAAEREACARLCDNLAEGLVGDDVDGAWGAGHCARAIEAKGRQA